AVCVRQRRRPAPAPARAGRDGARRRRGGQPRARRRPRAAAPRRRRHPGHGGGRRRQRPDRLPRHHRPALRPARCRRELSDRAAALAARRWRFPRARGRAGANRPLPPGAADRRGHGLLRRALLRRRPAHEPQGGAVTAVALRCLSVVVDGARILDGVSGTVEAGEWVTVIGPNGAGKSTLLRAVAGLVAADGGLEIGGEDGRALGRRAWARRVALVPQAPYLPPEMTVGQYVLLGRTPHLGYFGRESARDLQAADAALVRLDLVHLAGRRLATLSGGERQRAVLARAAPILLLDEPTSALDVGRGQQALELVDALRREQGLTVLAAMHDLTLAGQYADRLFLLDGGRVVAAGPVPEVLRGDLVARHYGAAVGVLEHPQLGLVVVPTRGRG